MPSRVEVDGWLEGYLGRKVGCLDSVRLSFKGLVEVRHVGVMVLAMMELHDLGRNGGLKSLGKANVSRSTGRMDPGDNSRYMRRVEVEESTLGPLWMSIG